MCLPRPPAETSGSGMEPGARDCLAEAEPWLSVTAGPGQAEETKPHGSRSFVQRVALPELVGLSRSLGRWDDGDVPADGDLRTAFGHER